MRMRILHIMSVYVTIVTLMACVVQYTHHHHIAQNRCDESLSICFCHEHHSSHSPAGTQHHCALHLAQMLVPQEDDYRASHVATFPAFDVETVELFSYDKLTVCEIYDELAAGNVPPLLSEIICDLAFTRGSPLMAV